MKITHIIVTLIAFLSFSVMAAASPIDLSAWYATQYDNKGFQTPSNWVLSQNNETVTQTLNTDPSMYLNGVNQTSYSMDGSWQVKTTDDDDFMGFIFGYQDAGHFYMMDWRQNFQNPANDPEYGTAYEGLSIKKVSVDSAGDLDVGDFWRSEGTDNVSVLASNFGDGTGWSDNVLYDFHLDFEPGIFTVNVSENGTEIWNVTVNDSSFTSGEFGFYNFSQSNVEYAGFEQTGGVLAPEPSTMFLLVSGIVGFVIFRKRFINKNVI
jgi:uncharacterized protein YdeI (BOF family)